MTTILTLPITAAVGTTTSGVIYQLKNANTEVLHLTIQGNLQYGSGGTSADVYVQTSVDGGANWCDIAEFSFTTTSAVKIVNLSALTPVTTVYTPTDGTLSVNTVKDGVIGSQIRAKYKSAGTYSTTTLKVDIIGAEIVTVS